MMTAHRCDAPGCGRFVRAGAFYCAKHQPSSEADDRIGEQAARQARFREVLEKGDYNALFDDDMSKVMHQAAKALAERGLVEEIGALRMVLNRLMKEEKDLSLLTSNVTRVASVAVQVARAQRAISGDVAQGLTSALTQILTELDDDP